MRQTLRQHAAPIRQVLRVVFTCAFLWSLLPSTGRAENNSSARREQAKAQFERAEKDRQALEARAEASRTLKEYGALVTQYERVYLTSSHVPEAPAAIYHVAGLCRTMGDLFDAKYYQRSIDSFRYLLREYPANKYREDSLLAIAQIEQDDLHQPAQARKDYQEFLTQHPRSPHAADVRAQLNILAAENSPAKSSQGPLKNPQDSSEQPVPKTVGVDRTQPNTDTRPGAPDDAVSSENSGPVVSRIRTWNADTYTRIVIDVAAKVKYQAARISGPDRIYFDLEATKLSPALLRKPIDLDGSNALKAIRFAQNQAGVVRVVLEVNHASDYSVFLLPDPYRLVVDVYGTPAAAEAAARSTAPAPGPTTTDAPPAKTERAAAEDSVKPSSKPVGRPSNKSGDASLGGKPGAQVQSISPPEGPAGEQAAADPAPRPRASKSKKSSTLASARNSNNAGAGDVAESAAPESSAAASANAEDAPSVRPATVKKPGRPSKSAHDQAEEMGPAPVPELTRDGQHSLTRALGLKVNRIVIDPGHGGHDTGTIGPTGLMEKDLCLDVSLRLGKLIQQRLPGADVIFTREDDTFIPLERRTEIANEAKADLFLSVHANSSQDRNARGIETYYLNFTGSSDAMQVAARENALSDNSVHDLQDIVKKIARNEKIEESRDLAAIVQDSLARRMDNINRGERNRGVRKAPFVVLIGADMPSVLAEISFLSNPSDEQWLKKPENRQRAAEGLYRGIESYLHSTNSLTYNQIRALPETRPGTVARTGNSQ